MGSIDFTAFRTKVNNEFIPTLNPKEHSGYAWAPLDDPPKPIHPGCQKVLKMELAQDSDFKEADHPRDEGGKFTSGGSGSGSGSTSKLNMSSMKKVGGQLGSNPGGKYEDD